MGGSIWPVSGVNSIRSEARQPTLFENPPSIFLLIVVAAGYAFYGKAFIDLKFEGFVPAVLPFTPAIFAGEVQF